MGDLAAVQVREGLEDLARGEGDVALGELGVAAADRVVQVAALEQLHHDPDLVIIRAIVRSVELHDVRMRARLQADLSSSKSRAKRAHGGGQLSTCKKEISRRFMRFSRSEV